MVGNGRSAEAKKSSSPIMCWIYAWQILSHNMSLIYACPQVWAIIVKEGGEIWPDGGRRDSRMRTVEVLLRWRGGLTFSGAKTARFVNSSRRPAHPLREDNYFTTVQSWGWYFHMVQSRKRRKKRTANGVAMDFWFTWQQDRIPFCVSLGIELLTSEEHPHEQGLLSKLELRGEFQRQMWRILDVLSGGTVMEMYLITRAPATCTFSIFLLLTCNSDG